MAFFTLQAGQPVYILNKESVPMVSVGTVTSVSQPRPSPQNWQQSLVTLVASVGGETRTFENLPSDKDMADSMTGLQVYCRLDGVIAEVQRMRGVSSQILADVDRHKAVVKACDGILCELSPEIAERAQRDRELREMREQLAEMREMFRQVVAAPAAQTKAREDGKDGDSKASK